MMMKGRRPTSSTKSLFIIFLLSAIHHGVLHVNANGDHTLIRLPLIHKYSPHFKGGVHLINKTDIDIVKELHLHDKIRHQSRDDHRRIPRRKDSETNSAALAQPLRAGSDLFSGLYWVEVKIGTPPRTFLLAADTGSDLTWVNCKYDRTLTEEAKQKKLDEMKIRRRHYVNHNKTLHFIMKGRVFHAELSSTFKPVLCSEPFCQQLAHMNSFKECPTPSSPCRYSYNYMGGDSAEGFFGYDTITVRSVPLGKKTKVTNVTIGCTESTYKFRTGDGVLGLGFGDYSFSETVVSYNFAGKFSYCLMNFRSNSSVLSYLSFGPNNQTVNSTMKYTKLVSRYGTGKKSGYYGVNVAGISIMGTLLKIPSEVWDAWSSRGGVLLDSGVTNTFLPEPVYKAVMDEMIKHLSKYPNLNLTSLPFEYCFNDTRYDESSVPRLTFHFVDGVRFEPPVRNYVVPVAKEVQCIGFVPGSTDKFIIGNQLQQNHLWEFDVVYETVGFAPSSCT